MKVTQGEHFLHFLFVIPIFICTFAEVSPILNMNRIENRKIKQTQITTKYQSYT